MTGTGYLRMNTCAAEACGSPCPSHHLMCVDHWRMVPALLKQAVLSSWQLWSRRGGNKFRSDYETARAAAIAAVREKEIKRHLRDQKHGDNLELGNGHSQAGEINK